MPKHNTGRPKCKLCLHNHWNHEPHTWDDKPDIIKEVVENTPGLTLGTLRKSGSLFPEDKK